MHHWLGAEGMPRRYADHLPSDGFTTLHMTSTVFSVLGVSTIPFLYNWWRSRIHGRPALRDGPEGVPARRDRP